MAPASGARRKRASPEAPPRAPQPPDSMSKIKITQVRSAINRSQKQKRTLVALGIRKMNQTVEHEATPQIEGMVRVVQHLVSVEEA